MSEKRREAAWYRLSAVILEATTLAPADAAKVLAQALHHGEADRLLLCEKEIAVVKALCCLPGRIGMTAVGAFVPSSGKQVMLFLTTVIDAWGDDAASIVFSALNHGVTRYVDKSFDETSNSVEAKIAAEMVRAALHRLSPLTLESNLTHLVPTIGASPSRLVRQTLAKELARFGPRAPDLLAPWVESDSKHVRFTATTAIKLASTPPARPALVPAEQIGCYAIDEFAQEIGKRALAKLPTLKRKARGEIETVGLFVHEESFRVVSLVLLGDDAEFNCAIAHPKTSIPRDIDVDCDKLLRKFFKAHGVDFNADDATAPTWTISDRIMPLLFTRELLSELQNTVAPAMQSSGFTVAGNLGTFVADHDDDDAMDLQFFDEAIAKQLTYFSDRTLLASFAALCFKDPEKQKWLIALAHRATP